MRRDNRLMLGLILGGLAFYIWQREKAAGTAAVASNAYSSLVPFTGAFSIPNVQLPASAFTLFNTDNLTAPMAANSDSAYQLPDVSLWNSGLNTIAA